jgi:hypothetical protein
MKTVIEFHFKIWFFVKELINSNIDCFNNDSIKISTSYKYFFLIQIIMKHDKLFRQYLSFDKCNFSRILRTRLKTILKLIFFIS